VLIKQPSPAIAWRCPSHQGYWEFNSTSFPPIDHDNMTVPPLSACKNERIVPLLNAQASPLKPDGARTFPRATPQNPGKNTVKTG